MSHDYEVTFPEFETATSFCRWIGSGVVSPRSDVAGFVWRSEGPLLDQSQKSRYDAYMGVDAVWHDDESGLTWMYSAAYDSLYATSAYGNTKSAPFFAGFSDWRSPTITELKTLRSGTQDKNGLWRTSALAGKTGPVLRSGTNGYDRNERRDWDFARDCSCEDEHRDSKIVWGSQGQYAGFEGGSSRLTGAEYIFVRGTDSARRPAWLQAQVQWSEEHRVDDFPVTEQSIGRLIELRVQRDNFPPYLDRLAGLRSLHVHDTGTLEPVVFALPALELLSWHIQRHVPSARQAVCLPSEVGNLKQLRKLSVDGPIELLPDSICDLGNLEELDIGWSLTALPAELGRLLKLRTLRLWGKRLDSIPPSIGELSALTELCIHAEGLRRLPEELGLLRSLVRLDMRRCSIQQLPARLEALRSLKVLSLEFNQLSEVPSVVWELFQLEELDLSFNPLTVLPSGLGQLKRLKLLNLCGAPIVDVPAAVQELSNLETLNLSGTQIQELPQWLWEMKSLRRLRIACTWKLPRLPKLKHPTIEVDYYHSVLDQPWGREWLKDMGKPD